MLFGVTLAEIKKAVTPAAVALVAVVAHGLASGAFDRLELVLGTAAIIHAFVAFMVTNAPGWAKAKAWTPLIANLIGLAALSIGTGKFEKTEWVGLGSAIVLALITGNVSNGGRTVPGLGSLPVAEASGRARPADL